MGDATGRWAPGLSYGPILTQRDLYLLGTQPELHPILANTHPGFRLVFSLLDGITRGTHPSASSGSSPDIPFTAKDEPATLPRVDTLIIITESSPWCTIVKNERGVTLGDVVTGIFKDYSENFITDNEFGALPGRFQDQIRRTAAHSQPQGNWGYYTPGGTQGPGRYRRFDWLRDRSWFDGLRRQDNFAMSRLGFKAGNVFVMGLM
ncbi:hypothetical protein C8J56DRAFT_923867 [Mycena floridula]|nr:hypothetical protein C8J56DRAFT_923867 [Mycena floridula]